MKLRGASIGYTRFVPACHDKEYRGTLTLLMIESLITKPWLKASGEKNRRKFNRAVNVLSSYSNVRRTRNGKILASAKIKKVEKTYLFPGLRGRNQLECMEYVPISSSIACKVFEIRLRVSV